MEIIDIKTEDQLRETWGPFIHTHHYRTATNFYDSWIAQQPRRTCEAMWRQLMGIPAWGVPGFPTSPRRPASRRVLIGFIPPEVPLRHAGPPGPAREVYGGLRVLPLTMSTQGCPIPDDHSGG